MNPTLLDGTDSHWLMYSDWLEERGDIIAAEGVRQEVDSSPTPPWQYEYRRGGVVGGSGFSGGVGGVGVGVGVGGVGGVGVGVGGVGVGGVGGGVGGVGVGSV